MKNLRIVAMAGLFCFLSLNLDAQFKTWLNLEAGPRWSLLKVSDPGGYFEGARVRSFASGITVGQEILPYFTLSTGVLYIPRLDGINMIDERPHQSSWPATRSIMIPLRVEYTIWPVEWKISFTPRIAYLYNRESLSDEIHLAGSVLSAPDGTALSYDIEQLSDPLISHLLELGAGFNFRFSNSWQASLNLSYITGLGGTHSNRFALDYTDGAGVDASTAYTSRGNAIVSTLALNIPVSNIWQNKDYRIRKRIENSTFKGKAVEKKGQFYLGGEFGSLWRSFSSSNPAVGPKPMEDRGLLQYANLHTGIYAGYMLSNEVGVDLGAYYQKSSTFLSLMYDHEVDLSISEPAPLYLEFPVRFRYFYDVYRDKVHLTLYAGVSLLTHFASDAYNSGTGDFTYRFPGSSDPVVAEASWEARGLRTIAPLMRLGGGVEYKLPTDFPVIATLYVNYMQGYMDMEQIEVSTTIDETPPLSTIAYSGSGWSVDLGVKIPFRLGRAQCGQLPEREQN